MSFILKCSDIKIYYWYFEKLKILNQFLTEIPPIG